MLHPRAQLLRLTAVFLAGAWLVACLALELNVARAVDAPQAAAEQGALPPVAPAPLSPPSEESEPQHPQSEPAHLQFVQPIGPGGGLLVHPSLDLSLYVPPAALDETVLISLALQWPSTQNMPRALVLLGGWQLSGAPFDGHAFENFDAPWQANIVYNTRDLHCSFCSSRPIDELSLHCLHRAGRDEPWVRTLSSVDVLDRRLACADSGTGDYAVVAEPLRTFGESSWRPSLVLLPVARAGAR